MKKWEIYFLELLLFICMIVFTQIIRNPYLLDYILSNFLGDKYKELDTPDKQAYEEYLKTYNIE